MCSFHCLGSTPSWLVGVTPPRPSQVEMEKMRRAEQVLHKGQPPTEEDKDPHTKYTSMLQSSTPKRAPVTVSDMVQTERTPARMRKRKVLLFCVMMQHTWERCLLFTTLPYSVLPRIFLRRLAIANNYNNSKSSKSNSYAMLLLQ